ncbi:hypothetical protein [[Mycobacterium] wendilense]|uniref:DUF1416 domain-containing protein n=1 Tax=[Mycobacterium] wendilense TaxID=3064284 RepID=A0ABM9M888_9MYCO|nr:hypothetical protein [Mycolicibacterium sp. MU0050]CAJ1578772.1 hypothetical protein MU0050_000192 [Mycolicibacterium sp. MU0050]
MTLRFEDPDGRALVDATVGIRSAPVEVHDITVNTDGAGRVQFDLAEPGHYEFFVVAEGVARTVGADLGPDADGSTLVVR